MWEKNIKSILTKLKLIDNYRQINYIYKVNIKEIKDIWEKFFFVLLKKSKINYINLIIDSTSKEEYLIKIYNESQKNWIYINLFYKIKAFEDNLNFKYNKFDTINYILDFKYNKFEKIWIEKNINYFNKNSIFYLPIDYFNNQEEVNQSYFLKIFNFLKDNNFNIATDFIRYESGYKNLYLIWPEELNFDINEYCNASCIFCNTNWPWYYNNRDNNINKHKQEYSIEKLLNIFKTAEYVWIESVALGITWEPFYDQKTIKKLFLFFKNTRLKVWFLTNGYLLLDNIENIINTKSITSFYINISAWNFESFKKVKQNDDYINFLNVWKAIKIIKEKRPDIEVKALFILTPVNLCWIHDFIKLAIKYNVDAVEFKEVVDYWFDKRVKFTPETKTKLFEILKIAKNDLTVPLKNNIDEILDSTENEINKPDENKKINTKCYNHFLYNSMLRWKVYNCWKFTLDITPVKDWALDISYTNLKNNNKIFSMSKDIKPVIWDRKYTDKCTRCFHNDNNKKIENYIKLKKWLINP